LKSQNNPLEGTPIYGFSVPRTSRFEGVNAEQFVSTLLEQMSSQICFSIIASSVGIQWSIVDFTGRTSFIPISHPSNTSVSQFTITPKPPSPEFSPRFHGIYLGKTRSRIKAVPILYVTDFKASHDPLIPVVNMMGNVKENEVIRYLLFVSRPQKPFGDYVSSVVARIFLPRGRAGTISYSSLEEKIIQHKVDQVWFETAIFLEITSPNQNRVEQLAEALNASFAGFDRNLPENPYNGLSFSPIGVQKIESAAQSNTFLTFAWYVEAIKKNRNIEIWLSRCSYLCIPELAALWHLPHEEFQHPLIKWSKKVVPVPSAVAQNHRGTKLGKGSYQGEKTDVQQHPQDDNGHTIILGKTGFGKSTLLLHLIHQRIQAGSGVAVIDPHGSLISAILRGSIPKERETDVVVLDLANTDCPPPLNPLRGKQTAVSTERAANLIAELFPDTDQRVQVSKYLNAALTALNADPAPTIRDVARIFTHDDYRFALLERLDEFENAHALDTWEQYEREKESKRPALFEPLLSRISPFYQKKELYPILCHPEGLDFQKLIQERKIILVSLKMDDEHVSEQERNLIGSLLISTLQLSGMKQSNNPYFIYVDEAEKFVTTSLNTLLSEARKFGLSLTLANQYAGQLAGKTLEAVEGNVTTTICFGCGVNDARSFAPYFAPEFEMEDLLNLNKFEAAVKLQHQGITQSAFSLFTDPPLAVPPEGEETERRIRLFSQQQYTPKSLDEIKAWLRQRYPRSPRKADGQGGENVEDIIFGS
jgi:hypothetical protein